MVRTRPQRSGTIEDIQGTEATGEAKGSGYWCEWNTSVLTAYTFSQLRTMEEPRACTNYRMFGSRAILSSPAHSKLREPRHGHKQYHERNCQNGPLWNRVNGDLEGFAPFRNLWSFRGCPFAQLFDCNLAGSHDGKKFGRLSFRQLALPFLT